MIRHKVKQICAAIVLLSMGCSNTPKDEKVSITSDADQAVLPVSMEASIPGDSAAAKPAGSTPVIINSVTPVPGSQQVPPPIQPVTTAPGMNPPHGQPGHRCDIAVGAPLNSPPGGQAPASPVMVTSPNSGQVEMKPIAPPTLAPPPGAGTQFATPPAPATTPPGMNPPHGQPGHDCTIAVGAPLKK